MIIPAKKNNLYEEISRQIIYMIKERKWAVGEKIPGEIQLSKSFEVSRNSVREALKALELLGLLQSKAGRGTFVSLNALANINSMNLASLIESKSSLIELMEARLVLEPGIAALAAEKADKKNIGELETILKKTQESIEENKYSFEIGFEFHKCIFRIANNKILDNIILSITEDMIESRKIAYFKRVDLTIVKEEIKEHLEILNLLKIKDSQSVYIAMSKHIKNVIDAIKILESTK